IDGLVMHMRMGRVDAEELKRRSVDRVSRRRAWSFIRPYRLVLAAYLGCIGAAAGLGVIPPLLLKNLIDTAIPQAVRTHPHDFGHIDVLAAGLVALAVIGGLLSLVNRWLGSRIGE